MYIGIDIGGHKINGVLLSNNRVIRKIKTATKSKSNKKIMIAQIVNCINWLMREIDKKRIKGIGIGVPGSIDFKHQKILNPPNVTALRNLFLGKIIQKKFGIKTKIDNDANCFGLAEAVLGAGKNFRIVAGLTLGTGVGGALIINKKIFHGTHGKAAEFGHMVIQKDGRKCNCGRRGCLEAYISANIANQEKEKYLEIGIINLVKILDPEMVVVGGGRVNVITLPASIKNTKIVRAKLGENAGAIGAALLFKLK